MVGTLHAGDGSTKGTLLVRAVLDEGVVIFGRLFDGGSVGEPHTIDGA